MCGWTLTRKITAEKNRGGLDSNAFRLHQKVCSHIKNQNAFEDSRMNLYNKHKSNGGMKVDSNVFSLGKAGDCEMMRKIDKLE